MKRTLLLALTLVLTLGLALYACGGDDDGRLVGQC